MIKNSLVEYSKNKIETSLFSLLSDTSSNGNNVFGCIKIVSFMIQYCKNKHWKKVDWLKKLIEYKIPIGIRIKKFKIFTIF